jgi:hypothetical protein
VSAPATHEKLLELCTGNTAAVAFVEGFWSLMVVWDDAIDRDRPVDREAINEAILWALFDLQDNPFFRANRLVLRGAMHQALATWLLSLDYERSGDPALIEQAYWMRYSSIGVFATAALLTGGREKQTQAIDYFCALARGDDKLPEYLIEHLGEHHGLAQFPQATETA